VLSVLAAGGYIDIADLSVYPRSATAASEVYDPISNAWTSLGPMSVERAEFRMTGMSDGRGGTLFPALQGCKTHLLRGMMTLWSANHSLCLLRYSHAIRLRGGRVPYSGRVYPPKF